MHAASDARGWGIASPTIAEFWMVVTHPSSLGGPSDPARADAFLSSLRQTGSMLVFRAAPSLPSRLTALAVRLGVVGPRVFDLQIGLIAQDAGAMELWTHDRRFRAPPGLLVRDPIRDPPA